jgi:chemotaxis protein CheD
VIDVFLQPGEFFVGGAQHRIRTLLGSCVSITLWHPGWRIGAMSHFLLGRSAHAPGMAQRSDGRYGNDALRLMLEQFGRSGIAPSECEGKIVGGGNMFPHQQRRDAQSVGQQNGNIARQLLQEAGIPIAFEHLYGVGHRQVLFEVGSGQLWVRQLDLVPSGQETARVAHG